MEYNLREYQAEALLKTQTHLRKDKKPAIASIATAGGKSIIIAKLCEWCASHPDYNVVVLTHRKELLEQNFSKIAHDSVGIVSAGLNKKEYDKQIVIAGIQSVWKKSYLFRDLKLIIVDECQALPNNKKAFITKEGKEKINRYWKFINDFPNARLVGFTATPFRLKDGALKWGRIIHHTGYKQLFELGFVAPLTNKILQEPDLSKLKIQSGEFVVSDMDKLYLEDEEQFKQSILKIVGYGEGRNCWIGFVPSVKMGYIAKEALNHYGISAEMISSKTNKKERKRILQEYKEGLIRCILNVNVLSEGFDNPNIDLIFTFRPTLSLGLWHQQVGRGVRLSSRKQNCLLLDFAGNLKTHGSLVDESWKFLDGEIIMPEESLKGRACPSCENYVKVVDNFCVDCGHEFLVEIKPTIIKDIDTKTDLEKPKNIFQWVNVTRVDYERNYKSKKGNTIPLKIIYTCGFSQVYDFIFDEGDAWFIYSEKRKPKRIKINAATQYPKVVELDYGS